jgi:outer membrane protein assembly factor BamB
MRASALSLVTCLLLPGCAGRGRIPPPPPLLPAAVVWTAAADSQISGSLVTDGTRVYVATRSGMLHALDSVQGRELWRAAGPEEGQVAWAQGRLVVRDPEGRLRGLDPENGVTLWEAETGVRGTLTPSTDGDRLLLAGDGLALVRARNGRTLWKTALSAPASTPAVAAAGKVLLGQSDGTLVCLDAAKGGVVWTHRTGKRIAAMPISDGAKRVYLGTTDRRVIAVGLDKGKLEWRWKIGADVQSQAATLGGMLLVATQEAVLYSLGAGNGHLRWRTPLPSRPFFGPLLVGSAAVVACSDDILAIFDSRTGKRIGDIRTPGAIRTPPLVVGDLLVVGLRTRAVVAFRMGSAPEPAPESAAPTEKKP